MAKKNNEPEVKIPFDIMRRSKIWFAISLLVIIPGIISMFVNGFNFGIDFTGGTIMDMRFEKQVTLVEIRDVLKEYGLDNATIQLSGEASNVESSENVMIRTVDLEENDRIDLHGYIILRNYRLGREIHHLLFQIYLSGNSFYKGQLKVQSGAPGCPVGAQTFQYNSICLRYDLYAGYNDHHCHNNQNYQNNNTSGNPKSSASHLVSSFTSFTISVTPCTLRISTTILSGMICPSCSVRASHSTSLIRT